jgi:Mce-associated membrane protein
MRISRAGSPGWVRFARVGVRGSRWVVGGLAVALVGLLVAIGLVATSRGTVDEELGAAQREVADAAGAEAVAFLTVDHRDMDPLIDAVLDGATGDFAEQYESQRERLTSEAVRTEATSSGEVVALGVGDLDDDSATVLVAANSTVTNTSTGREGEVRYYRLRLELVRAGDRWLTSNVEFVR